MSSSASELFAYVPGSVAVWATAVNIAVTVGLTIGVSIRLGPRWWEGASLSIAEAAAVSGLFFIGILLVGSLAAMGFRLLHEVVA